MEEKVLVKGNYAIAQAALNAGLECYFGYPITPQTEIALINDWALVYNSEKAIPSSSTLAKLSFPASAE